MIVSVLMITYGHEKYIRQAIESVLMQECNFDYELIVANDCSPDLTHDIVNEIISSNSKGNLIKYINHLQNIGMQSNYIDAYHNCKGKYIATCEGDDYWTDPLKLQKQVDFLESNPDYVLCFHPVSILKTNGEIVDDFITTIPENYETIETLARLGNYIHTPSVVFRNVIREFPFEFSQTPIGDYFLYMMLAEHGKLKYLEDKMCVYRYGVGVYSSKTNTKMVVLICKQYACLLSYLKDDSLKKIILDRNVLLLKSFDKAFYSKYTSNDYIIKHKSLKTILEILAKKIKRRLLK